MRGAFRTGLAGIWYSVVVLTLGGLTATAQGEDCYRHAECSDDKLCVDRVCASPESPPDKCDADRDCDGWRPSCDEGYCKEGGVYCENPAGNCHVEAEGDTCACADGQGSSGATMPGVTPPEMTDEELYEQCLQTLSSSCGEEAPDISEECTDEQLKTCSDFFDKVLSLMKACGEEQEEPGYSELRSCCKHDFGSDEFDEQYECVMSLDASECETVAECFPDPGTPLGVAGTGGGEESRDDESGGDESDEEEDDSGGGCTVAPLMGRDSGAPPKGAGFLVAVFLLARFSRSRTRPS